MSSFLWGESCSGELLAVDRVDPGDVFGFLDSLDVEIDDHSFVVAADHDAFERLIAVRIDLLMRHERRHIDEIAWTSGRGELERLAPTHARAAANDIDHALELAVMMRAGLRVWLDA